MPKGPTMESYNLMSEWTSTSSNPNKPLHGQIKYLEDIRKKAKPLQGAKQDQHPCDLETNQVSVVGHWLQSWRQTEVASCSVLKNTWDEIPRQEAKADSGSPSWAIIHRPGLIHPYIHAWEESLGPAHQDRSLGYLDQFLDKGPQQSAELIRKDKWPRQ